MNRSERRKQQRDQKRNQKKSNKVAEPRVIPSLSLPVHQKKVFSEEECEKILSCRTEWTKEDGKIQKSQHPTDTHVSTPEVSGLSEDLEYRRTTLYIPQEQKSVEWLMHKILTIVDAANSLEGAWKFDIRGILEPPNIMEYSEGSLHESGIDGHYEFHMDLGPDEIPSMRKISYSVILNDSYEGGKLNIKYSRRDSYPPQKTGDIIMFPPYMLHCVEPVTKGTRYALVGWVHGPSFL